MTPSGGNRTRPGGQETRARILRTAAGLFRRQGYGSTGLNQILAESGAPKGSLYFHFPGGKEQLAAEAVVLSGGDLGARMATAVAAADGPRAAVTALGALLAEGLTASGYRDGCPVATVALEQAGDAGPIHDACAATYDGWLAALRDRLADWGASEETATALADLALSSVQGALLLARVRRDAGVLHSVAERVGTLIEAQLTTATTGGKP
ncbi:TetR family transcriptional regulator [Streptomyces sp. Ru73]|uniref:TetR/AcrR family transcriptional regulator n=1 Tax=Streptomyces sp. Ru73 TaxID=2080748 RepID=UPI000CDD222A|nr:TetR/AcrR family transcriptional regulator [Streptomyces sp. Ru73]POX36547.1 TetR family transcriptional regulator [Streptomyces sp. Ru73]